MSCLSKKGPQEVELKGEETTYDHVTTTCIISFLHYDHDMGWDGMDDFFLAAPFLWFGSTFDSFSNAAEVLQSCLLRVGFFLVAVEAFNGRVVSLFLAMRLLDTTTFLPLEGKKMWSFDVLH